MIGTDIGLMSRPVSRKRASRNSRAARDPLTDEQAGSRGKQLLMASVVNVVRSFIHSFIHSADTH